MSRGIFWAIFVTGLSKFASLGSQVALGWLLTNRDFGVFAAAMSFAAFVSVLRDGGCAKLLIQRGAEYEQIARPVCYVSWIFNVTGALAILVASPFVAQAFGDPQVGHLLWIIALSLALGTPAMIGRSKLIYDMRFRDLAQVSSISVLIRHGGMVSLALLGFGPVSFVLPIVAVSLYEWWGFRRQVGALPIRQASTPFTWSVAKSFLGHSKWIVLGALATTMITQGDYLVLGLMTDPILLGTYFFGYQLTAAISSLFTSGIQQSIMPGFAKLKNEPERQQQAFYTSIRLMLLATTPLCLFAALAAPAFIELIWQGRWTAAVPVAQLMALALITRLAAPMGRALLEAMGRWRLIALAYSSDGICMMAVVASSIWLTGSDLTSIAIAIAAYRILVGLVHVGIASKATGGLLRDLFPAYTPIFWHLLTACVAAALARLIWTAETWLSLQTSLTATGIFVLLEVGIGITFLRSTYINILRRFRN